MESGPVVLRLQAPDALRSQVEEALAELDERRFCRRLWDRDPSLWKDDERHAALITNALGWLTVAAETAGEVDALRGFADEVRADGVRHIVLLGMGGSSLAPETLAEVFGPVQDYPDLRVLDSTDPGAVMAVHEATCAERRRRSRCCPRGCEQAGPLDLFGTLFVVASKSGTTVETASFHAYFKHLVEQEVGDAVGRHFVAITDDGTPLQSAAVEERFRAVFLNPADIGGRYSALSFFGMVPAALAGLDIGRLLDDARAMAAANGPERPLAEAPGVLLGAVLGAMAAAGRDKLTLLAPGALAPFGAWIEQLLAESTGKEGRGILPVDLEPVGDIDAYGDDRLFVHFSLAGEDDEGDLETTVAALAAAGHPVVQITLPDRWALGGQFLLWEIATAAAGSILAIDPFDQPNVQESKDNTRKVLDRYTETGALPPVDRTVVRSPGADGREVAVPTVVAVADGQETVEAGLSALFQTVRPGDYLCLQAYVTPSAAVWAALEAVRRAVRDRLRVATTAGYGPRYLHSTGQYHKGGPDGGVFVQLVADHQRDARIPGQLPSFAVLERAQADGDLESLRSRGRRIVRVELGIDLGVGLEAVVRAVDGALDAV